jgi:hypothetical protein
MPTFFDNSLSNFVVLSKYNSLMAYYNGLYSIESIKLIFLETSAILILTLFFFFQNFKSTIKSRKSDAIIYLMAGCISAFMPPTYGHYLIRAAPSIALSAGIAFTNITRRYIQLIFYVLLIINLHFQSIQYPNYNFNRFGIEWRYNDFSSLTEQLEISRYIKANSDVNDTIFVWGFNSEIYWLSGRNAINLLSWTVNCNSYYNNDDYFNYSYHDIRKNSPKFLIVPKGYDYDCINSNGSYLLDGLYNRTRFIGIGGTKIYEVISNPEGNGLSSSKLSD